MTAPTTCGLLAGSVNVSGEALVFRIIKTSFPSLTTIPVPEINLFKPLPVGGLAIVEGSNSVIRRAPAEAVQPLRIPFISIITPGVGHSGLTLITISLLLRSIGQA